MTSPIATAITEASDKLKGFQPYWFRGEPLAYDAEKRAKDIEDIGRTVSNLLDAIAAETRSEFGVNIDLTLGLEDNIGDAVGALSHRAEELSEEEHCRASRSYQRGSMSGVV